MSPNFSFKRALIRFSFAIPILITAGCQTLTPTKPAPETERSDLREPSPAPGEPTLTPFQPGPPEPEATAGIQILQEAGNENTRVPTSLTIWVDPALDLQMPEILLPEETRSDADLQIGVGEELPITERIYALVVPFPTLLDEVSVEELWESWEGDGAELQMDPETYRVLSAFWETEGEVELRPGARLLDTAWDRTGVLSIIPFQDLEPRWKVLSIEGSSPIHKDFDPESYPLRVVYSIYGESALVEAILSLYGPESPQPLLSATNRDPSKLSTVVVTGVTALVRATAWTMEQQGLLYPARDIGDWLSEADILHISNEVPFAEDCPYPNPVQRGVVFCSDTSYIRLMEDIGTDVVELTGDHFHDWGAAAMLLTLEMYAEHDWPFYGGGANFDQGKKPVFLEHNGNKFAFIGCNGKGGYFAQASATSPGSVHCDFDYLQAEIQKLEREGYLVIATFQHFEYYSYNVPAAMAADFRSLAKAGAAIVSGSQAHHPHGFEITESAFIHYGLGNLFFDQIGISPGTETAFIDRHVVYDGVHISTELLTIVFEDFARSRPMTPTERQILLRAAFSASFWP